MIMKRRGDELMLAVEWHGRGLLFEAADGEENIPLRKFVKTCEKITRSRTD